MESRLFIDNCWKDKVWRSTTTLRQKIVDMFYYRDKTFKSLIVGILIFGFALGFERKGVYL